MKGAAYIQCGAFLLAMIIVNENEQPKAYRRSSRGLAVFFIPKKPKVSSILKRMFLEKQFEKLHIPPFLFTFETECWDESTSGKRLSPPPPSENPHWKWHARMNKRFECTEFDKNERDVNDCVCCTLYIVYTCTLYSALHTRFSAMRQNAREIVLK